MISKAVEHAGNGNLSMAAVESLPDKVFVKIYRNRTGHKLSEEDGLWRLQTKEEVWHLPRPQDALRITHIGENPHRRVVYKYLKGSPWDTDSIDTVVDVGSFIGEFMIRGGFSGIALEPDHRNFKCLSRNVPDTVQEVCAAAWYCNKRLNLGEHPDGSETKVLFNKDVRPWSYQNFAWQLDKIINGNRLTFPTEPEDIDLVKIDAEGREPEVLAGAVGLKTRFAVDVGPERGGERTEVPCKAVLRSHGYRYHCLEDTLWAWIQ